MGQRDKFKPVIYCIENILNHKKYIGSATRGRERWRGHRSMLRRNVHFSSHLQSAWNKYGEDNFKWYTIEKVPFEDISVEDLTKILLDREEYWIKFYKTCNPKFGYNTRETCNTNLGIKWPEESKRKFSEYHKRIGVSPALREAVKEAWKRPGYKENHTKKYKEWYDSLTNEQKQAMIQKRTETNKKRYEENLKKYNSKIDPKVIQKIVQSGVDSGNYISVYLYYPHNGKFFKKFLTISSALKFFGISGKNTFSVKSRLDKDIFCSFIWSTTYYSTYPIDKLNKLKDIAKSGEIILETPEGNIKFYQNVQKLLKDYDFWENGIYTGLKKNNSMQYKNFTIYKIAPFIGDNKSKVGEFIESLYNGNNEASQNLNDFESCND